MTASKIKWVYFITGASGVGKTTLVTWLEKKYSRMPWSFLHFDSIGVPAEKEMIEKHGSGANWQRDMTDQWIDKILHEYEDSERIFLEGQVNLEFIKNGFAKHHFKNYSIILVDCDETTMAFRLTHQRGQPELVTPDMKNWLNYLRNQAHELNASIINTSDLSEEKAIQAFEKIIGL